MDVTGAVQTATLDPADVAWEDEYDTAVESRQEMEGLRILFIGFGTGMTVALVFLIYIVLSSAGAFP
jgi:hypothetical protein